MRGRSSRRNGFSFNILSLARKKTIIGRMGLFEGPAGVIQGVFLGDYDMTWGDGMINGCM